MLINAKRSEYKHTKNIIEDYKNIKKPKLNISN